MPRTSPRIFHLTLIKPSRYDRDGYVIQWRKTAFPSHALSVFNALAEACNRDRALGPDIRIEVEAWDDQCGLPGVEQMAGRIRAAGAGGMVCFVSIQSTQFPRAMDLARRFRARGVAVAMGGIHVSACFAMEPDLPPELQEMSDLGVTLFAGEAEEQFNPLLRDAHANQLKPVYNSIRQPVDLSRDLPMPRMPSNVSARLAGEFTYTPVETGRGCPFNCSFCTIINVYGRRTRSHTTRAVTGLIRTYAAKGLRNFLFTDDNFARNRQWREILEALIHLRESGGLDFSFFLQVDTQSNHDPDFIPLAVRAGCTQVFVGLENIHPGALASVGKKQNRVDAYREFFLEWKRRGVRTMAGYILGFPNDTPETVRQDLERIKTHLPVDLLYFFILTPLPGSADYQRLKQEGADLDPDLSNYSTYNAVVPHPRMTQQELESLFGEAWRIFYDDAHLARILKRHTALGGDPDWLYPHLLAAANAHPIDGIHPFESGLSRIKNRRERRPGLPLEPVIPFYARRVLERVASRVKWLWRWHRMTRMVRREAAHPAVFNDPALAGLDHTGFHPETAPPGSVPDSKSSSQSHQRSGM